METTKGGGLGGRGPPEKGATEGTKMAFVAHFCNFGQLCRALLRHLTELGNFLMSRHVSPSVGWYHDFLKGWEFTLPCKQSYL